MNMSRVTRALVMLSTASVVLFFVRVISYDTLNYWYLTWNLGLAWVPLLLAYSMTRLLHGRGWFNAPMALLTAAYVGFLPNSFYIATDFIHVQYAGNRTILFDIVMILLFTITGLAIGFASVYMLHKELIRRLTADQAHTIIGALLLVCSFAIYLGRFLRWNTWDVLTNPGGIIFDVSYRLVNPLGGGQMISTTVLFFVLLTSLYWSMWQIIHPEKLAKTKKRV